MSRTRIEITDRVFTRTVTAREDQISSTETANSMTTVLTMGAGASAATPGPGPGAFDGNGHGHDAHGNVDANAGAGAGRGPAAAAHNNAHDDAHPDRPLFPVLVRPLAGRPGSPLADGGRRNVHVWPRELERERHQLPPRQHQYQRGGQLLPDAVRRVLVNVLVAVVAVLVTAQLIFLLELYMRMGIFDWWVGGWKD